MQQISLEAEICRIEAKAISTSEHLTKSCIIWQSLLSWALQPDGTIYGATPELVLVAIPTGILYADRQDGLTSAIWLV